MSQEMYNPLNDPIYMSLNMKHFFKQLLEKELQKLEEEESLCTSPLTFEENQSQPDPIDQGTTENLHQLHHVFHEHEKSLFRQVENALRRLASGSYGYCIISGDPIGVSRLIAAPYTSYCLACLNKQEIQQKK